MAYAWAISIRPFSLLLFTLLFLDQFNPSMQREESQAIAVEVIDYLLHHASVDSFDKTLLQLYAGHLTSNLITDHIIEHQYDALTSSREKKLFVSKLISHQLATMSMELKRKMFNEVFATMPVDVAKKLAKHVEISSETSSIHADEMFNGEVYGEIEFSSFANIMQRCVELFRSSGHLTPNRKLVFVDLGHGTGKSLIALKFLFGDKFSRAHGIEYAQGLFNESVNRINMSIDIVDNNPIYSSVMRTPHENESFSTCQLCVEEGDFLAVPNDHASPISDHYDWTLAGKINK